MTLLTMRDVSITDTLTHTVLTEHIDFDLQHGETLGIIGESGSGKSITCKAIVGLNPKNLVSSGDIVFDGIPLNMQSEPALRTLRGRKIAMIMQQGTRAFNPSVPLGKQMIKVLRTHAAMTKQTAREVLVKHMTTMAFKQPEQLLTAYPHELSGGMLQRLMIVLALALEPELIIADEPTTALDTITQYEVLEAFKQIKTQVQCSMIFISHDLAVIKHVADQVIVMKEGAIVERGTTDTLLQNPKHPYTHYLLNAKKKINDHFKGVLGGDGRD